MNAVKALVNPSNLIKLLLIVLLIWFIGAFLLYPNLNLIYRTFVNHGALTMEPFRQLLHSMKAMRSLLNSFILAISLVVTVNIVGIFLVLATDYFDVRGAKILRLGYFTTLIYSGIILVSGYQYVYGPNGIVTHFLMLIFPHLHTDWFSGYGAVLFVMTFSITSNHIIFLSTALRKIDYQTIEIARNMGASEWMIIRKIVLPVLKPTIFAITVLNFLTGLSATSSPLVQGGIKFQTINPMILSLVGSMYSRGIAAILAIILGLATFIILLFLMRSEAAGNYIAISKVSSPIQKKKIHHKLVNLIMHAAAYFLFLIYVLPVIIICIFSFTDTYSITNGTLSLDRFTIANYVRLFTQPGAYKPYLVGISYSLGASVLVVLLCLVVSRILHKSKNRLFSRALEYSMLIPWLLPSSMIALGLIMTYDTPKWILGNYVLVGSIWMLLVGYIIVKIPFSIRLLKASFFSIDHSLEEAAKNMGAKPVYTFRRVILPIILPSTLAVIALNLNALLVDYDLTVFLYHPLLKPLSVVIYESTTEGSSGGSLMDTKAMALIYSVVVMVISSLSLYFIYGRKNR